MLYFCCSGQRISEAVVYKMNRVAIVFLMSFLSLFVSRVSLAQTPEGALLSIPDATCDFGAISRQDKDLVREVGFVNEGSTPLVILSVTTSCSCLKADFSRKPVAPKESGTIRIICESRKMEEGVFHRVVRVNSNSADGVHLITVQGNVSEKPQKLERWEKTDGKRAGKAAGKRGKTGEMGAAKRVTKMPVCRMVGVSECSEQIRHTESIEQARKSVQRDGRTTAFVSFFLSVAVGFGAQNCGFVPKNRKMVQKNIPICCPIRKTFLFLYEFKQPIFNKT